MTPGGRHHGPGDIRVTAIGVDARVSDQLPHHAKPRARPAGWASVCFLAFHLTPLLVLATGLRWQWLGWAAVSYAVRMFAITAGYHRYFSHRAFRTSRVVQFLLAWLAQTSVQKGVLWWASHHRVHHKRSDTEDDVHAPSRGFWWSHAGWFLSRRWDTTDYDAIKDFSRFPELVWLNEQHLVPFASLVALAAWLGGLPGLVWGVFLPTIALWHATFAINSLAHVFGRRRYLTADTSRNSFLLALLTGGEGWHNNHHFAHNTANQGWFWWELDLTFVALRALSWVGVVRDLRVVRPEKKNAHHGYTPEQRALLAAQGQPGLQRPKTTTAPLSLDGAPRASTS